MQSILATVHEFRYIMKLAFIPTEYSLKYSKLGDDGSVGMFFQVRNSLGYTPPMSKTWKPTEVQIPSARVLANQEVNETDQPQDTKVTKEEAKP